MGASSSSRAIHWPAVLADFRRSGLTHVQFCSDRGISIHAFRHHLYRPRNSGASSIPPAAPAPASTKPTRPAFLSVHIRPAAPTVSAPVSSPSAPLELVLDGRHVLRVPAGFDADALCRLLDVLEARP